MKLYEYQNKAVEKATYNKDIALLYNVLGLSGNAGMLAYQLKNILHEQDGKLKESDIEFAKGLLGDVMWYVANTAHNLGLSLDEVALESLQNNN